jgi:hypothetical protein
MTKAPENAGKVKRKLVVLVNGPKGGGQSTEPG